MVGNESITGNKFAVTVGIRSCVLGGICRYFKGERNMKLITSTILIVGALTVGAMIHATTLAIAAEGQTHSKPPCQDDVATLCKGVKPGNGAIGKCLQDNEDKLSGNCKAEIQKISPCRAGAEKFCSGKHGLQLRDCVKQHRADIVAACKTVATAAKASVQARPIFPFCMADARKFCKQYAHPTDPQVNDCLTSHQSELSGACKTAMQKK